MSRSPVPVRYAKTAKIFLKLRLSYGIMKREVRRSGSVKCKW